MCTKTDGHQGLVKPYNVCGNREDQFAVAVYKDRDIVGHVPRSIPTQYIEYIDTVYREVYPLPVRNNRN